MKELIPVILCCWALLCMPSRLHAQNLVPNPSFEQYNRCPATTSAIVYPNPPANLYPSVTDWSNPVQGSTPDYFNVCGGSMVSVPINAFGNVMARTGVAYAGFYVVEERTDGPYREYISARLDQALIAGRQYYVSFYVRRGAMNTRMGAATWYSNDNISTTPDVGAYISQRRVLEPQYTQLSYIPQAANPPSNYIDTLWTRVDGVMTATGGERWITIGNFNPNHNYIPVEIRNPSDTTVPICYFYVDDVCVIDVSDSIRVHELRKCADDDSLVLHPSQPVGSADVQWSTGDTTHQIAVRDTGVYWVSVVGACSFRTDTFRVYSRLLPAPEIGNDTTYCFGAEVILDGSNPAFTGYSWSTGETTAAVRVTEAGTYVLTATDGCEVVADTVTLSFYPPVDPPEVADTMLCLGAPWNRWHFDTSGILWYRSNGTLYDEMPLPNTSEQGIYSFQISKRQGVCESGRDSFATHILAPPNALALPDTVICHGAELYLSVGGENMTYLWHTGDTNCCITISEASAYYVDISNACGHVRASGNVEIIPCDNCIWLPNAFSPTGDGKNDLFRAVVRCPVTEFRLRIFDRWGKLVFETVDPVDGWDGQYAGAPASLGVYYYTLEAKTGLTGSSSKVILKGDVLLLR